MKSFSDEYVVNINIGDRSSNIVLDTSICNDESMREDTQRFDSYIIKLLNLRFKIYIIVFVRQVK